jgi:very-short-patch-repair endonuclease
MGKSNYFINKNMGEACNTEYRKEQVKTTNILRNIYPQLKIVQEYEVYDLTLDGTPTSHCVLDIAIPSKKIAIRLMGGIHQVSKSRIRKDEFQKESLLESGWKVIDMIADEYPNLWGKKDLNDVNCIREVMDMIKPAKL